MPQVLIIEDDDGLREVMQVVLESEGFTVAAARDGEQGMQLQRSDPADVVVTDIFMPGKDGIETILELRNEFPRTRIIAMSGKTSFNLTGYLGLAQELGAVKVLTKPVELKDLVEAVRLFS